MLSAGRILGVFGLFLCGCTIQAEKVEESIKDTFKKNDVEFDKLKCPTGEKLKEGATFECEGTSDRGDDFVIKVKQTDDKGTIKWDLVGRLVEVDDFVNGIKKQSGAREVNCGKTNFIAVKGTKVKCKVDGVEVTLVFTDDEGSYKKKD